MPGIGRGRTDMTGQMDDAPGVTGGRPGLRTLIALTMLLIASLGAGIAGWAAIKQQDATNLERRLAQAQTMELADRMPLIDASRSARLLQERLEHHLDDANRLQKLADAARQADPARAQRYSLDAQEAQLLANALRPFVEFLPNILAPANSLDERRIGLVAVGSLQRRGFQAQWIEAAADPNSGGQARITYLEKERIEIFDEQVLGLAIVVVGLVASLVGLTLADLSGARPGVAIALYLLAIAGAGGAIATALWIDDTLIGIVGGVATAFAFLVGVAWLLGWLGTARPTDEPLQPQGIDQGGFAGGSVQIQETHHGFSRLLIVAIALAALVSSVIGYWYAVSGSRGDDAAHEAYQQQLDVVRRSGRASTAVITTFEGLSDLYERRVRCRAARNRSALAGEGRITEPSAIASLDEVARCGSLTDTNGDPRGLIDLDRRFGPQADTRFPLRLQQHVTGVTEHANTAESLALWDGYGELAAFWHAKTTSFLAGLTIIAIALYVLGQALAMVQLGVARAMAACGIAMTLGALGWSALTWARPLPTGSASTKAGCDVPASLDAGMAALQSTYRMRASAHNYALGSLKLIAADSTTDFASAISSLECAVEFRASLALAYHDLAGAAALSQSAHKGQSYYSLPTKERLDDIERSARLGIDIQRRLELAPNAYALNSHAVALWGLGVRDGKIELIRQALDLVDRAIAIAERLERDRIRVSAEPEKNLYPWLSVLPLLHLNRSLFLIATDRLDEGRAAAERALTFGVNRDWSLGATMITATGLLDANCERLHPAARCVAIRLALADYKRALLEGAWEPEAKIKTGRIPGAALVVAPSQVSLAVRIGDFDPDKDRLSVIWSVTDPQWGVQDALTNIVPPATQSDLRVIKDRGVYLKRNVLPGGGYRRCLSPGQYTAEVFLNGRLETSVAAELKGPALTAARLEVINLAFCHPVGWTVAPPPEGTGWSAEPMVSFLNQKGAAAAYLLAIPMPQTAQADAAAADDAAVNRALGLLARRHPDAGTTEALKARLKPCDKAGTGDIARGLARSGSGLAHIALILVDALDGVPPCSIMNTVTLMH